MNNQNLVQIAWLPVRKGSTRVHLQPGKASHQFKAYTFLYHLFTDDQAISISTLADKIHYFSYPFARWRKSEVVGCRSRCSPYRGAQLWTVVSQLDPSLFWDLINSRQNVLITWNMFQVTKQEHLVLPSQSQPGHTVNSQRNSARTYYPILPLLLLSTEPPWCFTCSVLEEPERSLQEKGTESCSSQGERKGWLDHISLSGGQAVSDDLPCRIHPLQCRVLGPLHSGKINLSLFDCLSLMIFSDISILFKAEYWVHFFLAK